MTTLDPIAPPGKPWLQGWLTVFQVVVLALVVDLSASIISDERAIEHVLLYQGGSSVIVVLFFPVVGLVLIWRRSRYARGWWIGLLSLLAAVVAVMTAIDFAETNQPLSYYDVPLLSVAVDVLWLAYWIRSRRVRMTFPPLRSPDPDPLPHGGRRWPTRLWRGAAVIVAAVLLFVFASAPGSAFIALLLLWLIIWGAWRFLHQPALTSILTRLTLRAVSAAWLLGVSLLWWTSSDEPDWPMAGASIVLLALLMATARWFGLHRARRTTGQSTTSLS